VGITLTKKASRNLTVLRAWCQSKFQQVSILQCYAPTNTADQEVKEELYEQLQSVLKRTPNRDITIALDDFNAKVENDNSTREIIMKKEGLDTMSENGELFTDFCEQNDLVIAGTVFPHRKIHKVTWCSPDSRTENQLDHFTNSRRWRRTLEDFRAYRGADAGSDHTLVIGKLKARIQSIRKSGLQRNQGFHISKLKTPAQQKEFSLSRNNRFQALVDLEDGSLENKWERVKSTFTTTAEKELGFKKREFKSWLSGRTIKKIEERRSIKQCKNMDPETADTARI